MRGNKQCPLRAKRNALAILPTIALILSLSGCGDVPTFDILGSYFPAWLVCILIGIALSAATSVSLSAGNRQALIRWSIVTYPCLTASIAFTLWLFLFS